MILYQVLFDCIRQNLSYPANILKMRASSTSTKNICRWYEFHICVRLRWQTFNRETFSIWSYLEWKADCSVFVWKFERVTRVRMLSHKPDKHSVDLNQSKCTLSWLPYDPKTDNGAFAVVCWPTLFVTTVLFSQMSSMFTCTVESTTGSACL